MAKVGLKLGYDKRELSDGMRPRSKEHLWDSLVRVIRDLDDVAGI